MPNITIGPTNGITQKYDITWLGATTTINVANFPWFTAAYVANIFAKSANRQGYISNKPSAGFPSATQFVQAPAGGLPYAYELNLKAQITIDSALFGLAAGGSNAPIAIPLDGTTIVPGETIFDSSDQTASFNLPATLTATFSQGTGTVQVSTDAGATWVSVPTTGTSVALPAATPFTARVQHTAGAAFYATLTATF